MAPNFVHSCDAAHLMKTVSACVGAGITEFQVVHDSFAVHAQDAPALADKLRREFYLLYAGDVLKNFYNQIAAHVPEDLRDKIPQPPEQGDFDLREVMKSRYFFA